MKPRHVGSASIGLTLDSIHLRLFVPTFRAVTDIEMNQLLYFPLLFLFWLQLVSAQFQFFENMFGQQQQHHQQQQQRSGASQWAAYSDSGRYILPNNGVINWLMSPLQFRVRNIFAQKRWTASRDQPIAHAPIQKISNAQFQIWRAVLKTRPWFVHEGRMSVLRWRD